MRNIIFIGIILYTGCSRIELPKNRKVEPLLCKQKVKPKSLQFLEQKYRCQTQK
jgi:hypothetical protein